GIVGLIISALLAAAISSLDSALNCLAAVGVDDYYKKLKPNATDAQQMRLGKILVILARIGAMIVASVYVSAGDMGGLGIVFMLYAISSGGSGGIVLRGMFVPRSIQQGLSSGIAACVLFTAYALLTSTPIRPEGNEKLISDYGEFNYGHH